MIVGIQHRYTTHCDFGIRMNALETILTWLPSRTDELLILVGAALAGVWHFFCGPVTPQHNAMFVLLAADYAVGVIAAIRTGDFSRSKGFNGFVKKTLCLGLVALAHQIDIATSVSLAEGYLVSGICVNEALSVIKNLRRAGVPLPEIVDSWFERLSDRLPQARSKNG